MQCFTTDIWDSPLLFTSDDLINPPNTLARPSHFPLYHHITSFLFILSIDLSLNRYHPFLICFILFIAVFLHCSLYQHVLLSIDFTITLSSFFYRLLHIYDFVTFLAMIFIVFFYCNLLLKICNKYL